MLVESAIVLGTFVVMMVGVLDLGLAVLRQNSLDAAARQVARAAVVRGAMAASDQVAWGPARYASRVSTSSEIANMARDALATIDPQDVSVVVDWPDGGNQPEQRVRVRLAYQHSSIIPMLYGRHLDMRSECVMRIAH
jgi:Flp pilus assembly protein TadG